MGVLEHRTQLPDTEASDEEINRYAELLDTLEIGLIAFSAQNIRYLSNKTAEKLLGAEISEQIVSNKETKETVLDQVWHTRQPVFDHIMALPHNEVTPPVWLSVNAIPFFSRDGSVRRVLLTFSDITDIRQMHLEMGRLATHNPLTNTFNQRTITHLLENEVRRAQRYGTPFTVAQVDIDQFLPLCEKFGQKNSDLVLVEVGNLLNKSVREIDMVGHLGNDEFLIILPNVGLQDAITGMERLRSIVEIEKFTPKKISITISGGITEYTGENATAMIERSKALMVNAREAGRNCFCLDDALF